jgi:hypothetical protein
MLAISSIGFAQITWKGTAGDGLWSSATNWSTNTVPTSTDQVILDNVSGVPGSYTVTLPTGAVTTSIKQLTITPAGVNTITLILPVGNTSNPGLQVSSLVSGIEDIIINNGGILMNSSGASLGPGIQVTLTGGIFRINNGGKYIHNTLRTTGGTAPFLSTAVGTELGIYEYDVPGTAPFAVTASGTNYGSLTLTRTAGSATYTASGSSACNLNGNLTVNTGVTFTSAITIPGAFNINGNMTNLGTAITMAASQATHFNGTGLQTISGSGSTSFNGTTTIASTSTTAISQIVNFNGTVNENGTFQINQGGNPSATVAWNYTNGTLVFANTTGSFPATIGNNVDNWWPSSNGPSNVTLNGAGGVTLNAASTKLITGTLTLTNGILTANSLIAMDVSSSVTGASNASYVDGPIQKIGGTDFTFPVGKKILGILPAYVPIMISGIVTVSPSTTAFTAEYKRKDASALGPIAPPILAALDHVSKKDYWTLFNSGGTTPSATVTAYWTNENTFGGSAGYISNLAALVIARFNGTSFQWDNFGGLGTYGGSSTTAGSLGWTGVTAFDTFALASITFANPLPITVNYLNGVKQSASNILNWQVSCVNNLNATMILERSADNRNFTNINTVTATAVRCQQPFDFTDNNPLSGVNYYRLKTINDDGKISYSTSIAILNKQTGFEIVSLLPNIIHSDAVLNVTSAQKTKLNIVITDVMGRQVQQVTYNLIAGSNQFNINVVGLAAGTYQLSGYTAEGINKTIRFVKQ